MFNQSLKSYMKRAICIAGNNKAHPYLIIPTSYLEFTKGHTVLVKVNGGKK